VSGRVLVVTNDFPPRAGGIQTFVYELVRRLPPAEVTVFTSTWKGAAEFDAEQPFEVIRIDGSMMLPVPAVRRQAVELVQSRGVRSVVFGAAVPLGLMAPALREAGATRLLGITHGHEASWASVPGGRSVVRRVASGLDVLTYLGDFTRGKVAAAVGPDLEDRLHQLTPGVDPSLFRPGAGRDRIRERLGVGSSPVVVCVSRLMPRKGQDTLIRCWPAVLAAVPDARLVIVGGGPSRERLTRLAVDLGVSGSVTLTGSVPFDDLPAHYAAGDVFAMPCRTRGGGLDVEGLGIVYLEASSTGLPVIAGDSGGAPDAVLQGKTGFVVDGRDASALSDRVVRLLTDHELAQRMGERGRAWVEERWTWEAVGARLSALLNR
jgi:phosphatidylinositol alpha-1,6-mannosyltransferase